MRLVLFSSRGMEPFPNLVAIQHPALDMLPTVLVCPVQHFEYKMPPPFRPEKVVREGQLNSLSLF